MCGYTIADHQNTSSTNIQWRTVQKNMTTAIRERNLGIQAYVNEINEQHERPEIINIDIMEQTVKQPEITRPYIMDQIDTYGHNYNQHFKQVYTKKSKGSPNETRLPGDKMPQGTFLFLWGKSTKGQVQSRLESYSIKSPMVGISNDFGRSETAWYNMLRVSVRL